MAVLFEHDGMMHLMRKNEDGRLSSFCSAEKNVAAADWSFTNPDRTFDKVCGACITELEAERQRLEEDRHLGRTPCECGSKDACWRSVDANDTARMYCCDTCWRRYEAGKRETRPGGV